MNYESNRLNTFSNWPIHAEIDPIRIAKAGFYFTGRGVEVQCFSCGGKISEWHNGDQVMSRHRRLDPSCPFVVNPRNSGNVALMLDPLCVDQSIPERSTNVGNGSTDLVNDGGASEDDELYKSEALRVLSFVNWTDNSVSREELVRVGFFHVGEGRIRCAWCGGEIARMRRLGVLGQPLEIHQRYFPNCSHATEVAARDAATALANFPSPPEHSPPTGPRTPPRTPPDLPTSQLVSPPSTPEQPSTQTEGAMHNQRVLSSGGTWRALGVVGGAGGARNTDLASLAARLLTYRAWPADRAQAPQDMAEAGFFYTGCDDQVRCFYCDGGLGKWEAGDRPWREHARWFPHCGYLLLIKGPAFVNDCTEPAQKRTSASDAARSSRRLNPSSAANVPVSESQVAEQMESPLAASALGAGLDAARVRRAIVRRLRSTGLPFSSSEALIDAVLDEQLNEEAWSVSPQSQRFAREILADTIREFAPANGRRSSHAEDRSDSRERASVSPRLDPQPTIYTLPATSAIDANTQQTKVTERNDERSEVEEDDDKSPLSETRQLKEENRQLREARQCKVCMDGEVSVVFLPCGHLVSCARCGAGLGACPLCRARVLALVRAYLA